MEASTLQAPARLATGRLGLGTPLLRFRSDEQLVALFRAGHDEAFRAIHDRYNKRLMAYARQMLPARQDAEDALQDVFVRAYSGLRSSDRQLALRAWLFRVAHNRCIDELRRPGPPAPEVLALLRSPSCDPIVEVDLRESVRRLVEDIRRLPDQQRSALLMRELGGMSYADLACTLDTSVPAVKSLLVRARLALARAAEARDTACSQIREQLVCAHDRGVRPNATARRHMRDCSGCRCFRRELRGVSHQLAALVPVGPLGVLAQVLGLSGGGATVGGGSAAIAGGSGTAASAGGLVLGANHVATLLVAAVATAGGAVEIQHTITASQHHAHARALHRHTHHPGSSASLGGSAASSAQVSLPPFAAAIKDRMVAPPEKASSVPSAISGAGTVRHKRHSNSGSQTGGGATVGPVSGGATTGSTTGTDTASTEGSSSCAAVTPATSSTETSSSTSSSSAKPSSSTSSSSSTATSCTGSGTTSSTAGTSSGTTQPSGSAPTGTTQSGTASGSSTGTATTEGGTTGGGSGGSTTTASVSTAPPPGTATASSV